MSFMTNSTTVMQPTLQPGLPYMSNLFPSHSSHSFPILYSGPFPHSTTRATEIQPVSLYTEYLGNPYNTLQNAKTESETGNISVLNANISSDDNSQALISSADVNQNSSTNSNVIENNNSTIFFQSSNYFNNVPNSNLFPVGSEILFGVNAQNINSNVDENDCNKSVTGV